MNFLRILTVIILRKKEETNMGWKDDARLSVHLYGDTDNFIFLSIQQDKDSPIIGGNKNGIHGKFML